MGSKTPSPTPLSQGNMSLSEPVPSTAVASDLQAELDPNTVVVSDLAQFTISTTQAEHNHSVPIHFRYIAESLHELIMTDTQSADIDHCSDGTNPIEIQLDKLFALKKNILSMLLSENFRRLIREIAPFNRELLHIADLVRTELFSINQSQVCFSQLRHFSKIIQHRFWIFFLCFGI